VLTYLTSDTIGNILNDIISEEEKDTIIAFIDFLDQNELIHFAKDISLFPPIAEQWDAPAIIQNAIVDVDTIHHDFDKIFHQLDELGCQFVQIRSFSNLLTLEDVEQILAAAKHTSVCSVELLIKYNPHIADDAYIELVESQPFISNLTLHSALTERKIVLDYGCDAERGRYIQKEIQVITQTINSQIHCGIINIKFLNAPATDNFFETKLYNGCLNRKVAVDAFGEIKNCPSMTASYGNIKDTSLSAAINNARFKDKWKITKDQVAVCKDCEFRYVCSDCRAYLENPDDLYSKPLKCGYNPYTCEWEEWSDNAAKQKAIAHYGMKELFAGEQELLYK